MIKHLLLAMLWTVPAMAQAPLKIGVLNDLSGVYADYQGIGSVIAAQMAAEDFGKAPGGLGGRSIEILSADHQNKPDVGAQIVRAWFDTQAVDMVIDVPNSSIALAVADIAREKNKVFIGSGAGSSLLTGEKCSPNTVHWTYDTWEAGHALGQAIVARGGKNWYFLTADYGFGTDLEGRTSEAVIAAGGKTLGSARHPLGAADFSSFLVQAKSSGADVLGMANAGGDTATALKQAREFGLTPAMKVAGPIININTIEAVGLADTQGVLATTPFYWDFDDGTRAFAKRFSDRHPRRNYPNDMQAGVYAATLHYLKAVAKLGASADGRAVVDTMKALPTDDPLFGHGVIRADGRKTQPVYLIETKPVADSKSKWDMFRIVATVPADKAYRPLADGKCPLVKPAG